MNKKRKGKKGKKEKRKRKKEKKKKRKKGKKKCYYYSFITMYLHTKINLISPSLNFLFQIFNNLGNVFIRLFSFVSGEFLRDHFFFFLRDIILFDNFA